MMRALLALGVLGLLLSGCVSTRSSHGYVVEFGESGVDALPGIDSKESVLARFGEPSVRPPLNDDTWYYISQRTNARAFFRTEVFERTVVAFEFNDEGLVQDVSRYTLADGTNVDVVNRTTATRGRELSFIEQLLGGVGQIAPAGGPGQGNPNGPPQ